MYFHYFFIMFQVAFSGYPIATAEDQTVQEVEGK